LLSGRIRATAAIVIRGIGQSDFIPTVEPGVGVYLDGVHVARPGGGIPTSATMTRRARVTASGA
jgi:iron complex outermembrane receptor protein